MPQVKAINPPFNTIRQISKELLINLAERIQIKKAIEAIQKLDLFAIAEKADNAVAKMKEALMKVDMLDEAVTIKLKIMNEKLDKLSMGGKQ